MSIHPQCETGQFPAAKVTIGGDAISTSKTRCHATQQAVERALELIAREDYRGATGLLLAAGYEPQLRDLLGVCLMRSGDVEQAVRVYRQLVLMPNSVLERPDVSDVCKRNFATALLLKGLPSGALGVLEAMRDSESIRSVQIRAAIIQWAKTLPFFRRLEWNFNQIEPPNCKVPIAFEPGEIEFENQRASLNGSVQLDVRLAA